MPLLLRLYLGFAAVSGPVWRLLLWLRQRRGLEDDLRGRERLGHFTRPRPEGTLLWFHAASVGEAQAIVTLLGRLIESRPELSVVLTTHTVTSAGALAARGLPARVQHQFAPADTPAVVRRFLAHWRPDALIVAEADLWPVMLTRAKAAGLPLILVNFFTSPGRNARRSLARRATVCLLDLFDAILARDDDAASALRNWGVTLPAIVVTGSLKASSQALPDAPEQRSRISAWIAGRPTWLAASTHPAEDEELLQAHHALIRKSPDYLMILAPRHPHKIAGTVKIARRIFGETAVSLRSAEQEITPETRVYLADTIGEMGLWYRLSPVSYIGQSLPNTKYAPGGKNPFEAAVLDSVIVHGPCTADFLSEYEALDSIDATVPVRGAEDLPDILSRLSDERERYSHIAAAKQYVSTQSESLALALDVLNELTGSMDNRHDAGLRLTRG